jgi:hypothetical protein
MLGSDICQRGAAKLGTLVQRGRYSSKRGLTQAARLHDMAASFYHGAWARFLEITPDSLAWPLGSLCDRTIGGMGPAIIQDEPTPMPAQHKSAQRIQLRGNEVGKGKRLQAKCGEAKTRAREFKNGRH